MSVKRVLIPCGGKGTRMAGVGGDAPKELLPVAGIPMVLRVLRECRDSGITSALLVIAPHKKIIEAEVRRAARHILPVAVDFVVQPEPRGLADAMRLGRDFAGDQPLAVALPDNLFVGAEPGLAQVISVFERSGKNTVAVVEIHAQDAVRRGPTAVFPGRVAGDTYEIESIPDKGAKGKTFDTRGAERAFTGVGRYVFTPELFETIDGVERLLSRGDELDDVPVMQQLLAQDRLIGALIRGQFLDLGIPGGYEEANARLTT